MARIGLMAGLALMLFAGCKVKYTLSGQSIPADAKTVSVGFFVNKAALAPPTFSRQFTGGVEDQVPTRDTASIGGFGRRFGV